MIHTLHAENGTKEDDMGLYQNCILLAISVFSPQKQFSGSKRSSVSDSDDARAIEEGSFLWLL